MLSFFVYLVYPNEKCFGKKFIELIENRLKLLIDFLDSQLGRLDSFFKFLPYFAFFYTSVYSYFICYYTKIIICAIAIYDATF